MADSVYKDEEVLKKVGSFLTRTLPTVGFIFLVKLLDAYLAFPLAMGLGSVCYGAAGYWIPPRPKRTLLNWIIIVVLYSVAMVLLSWLTVRPGWLND